MRLLFFSEQFHPDCRGGAGRIAGDVCHALHQRGHRIDAICPAPIDSAQSIEIAPGFRVHNFPVANGPGGKRIRDGYAGRILHEAWDYLQSRVPLHEIDLIHDNGGFFRDLFPVQLRVLEALPQVPFVLQFQIQWRPLIAVETGTDANAEALSQQQAQLARRAQRILFLSRAERDEGIGTLGLGGDIPIEILPNAIPMARFDGLETFVPLYERPGAPVIALAGRLSSPSKGMDLALKALESLVDRHDFEVRLIGHRPETADIPPRLAARTRGTGWLDPRGVAEALHGAAAFLMPSRYEPFGILALEAHAVYTPVVAMGAGGLLDIIEAEETGLLVDPARPVEDLARQTARLLTDDDLREDLAIAAHARLLAHFTLPRVVDRCEAIYRELVPGLG